MPDVKAGRVQRAVPGDAVALTDVYLRSFRAALPHVRLAHSDDAIGEWMLAIVIAERETWLVDVDSQPVGFLSLDLRSDAAPSALDHLYLAPEWRGHGFGDLFVTLAKRLRPTGLELWTFQANTAARRFYARHGFVEVELTDGSDNEEGEPDARLVWAPVVS